MGECIRDRLLQAAAGCGIEALDEARRKLSLLGARYLTSAAATERFLYLIKDCLLETCDLEGVSSPSNASAGVSRMTSGS